MDEIGVHIRPTLLEHVDRVAVTALTVVSAPGGSGKTTLLRAWRDGLDTRGLRTAWIGMTPLHGDIALLVEDLVCELQRALPQPRDGQASFGSRLLIELAHLGQTRPAVLGALLAGDLRALDEPVVLFLDGYELVRGESAAQLLIDELLRDPPAKFRLVIATRGARPFAVARLAADGDVLQIGPDQLGLHTNQLKQLLGDLGVGFDAELIAQLLARTRGWAMGVVLAGRALAEQDVADRDRFIRRLGEQRDEVFAYIASVLLARASKSVIALLEVAALLRSSRVSTLLGVANLPDGQAVLDEALDEGLLVADGDVIWMHDLWSGFLRQRMQEQASQGWVALYERTGSALEELGELERAVELYAGAGLYDRASALLEAHGDLWLGSGRFDTVSGALDRLPSEMRRSRPALIALDGVLLSGREPERALEHLKLAASMYHEAGNLRAEMMMLHELGILVMNINRPDEIRTIIARVFSLRRLVTEPSVRGLVLMGLGTAAYQGGRYTLALRLLAGAKAWDHHPRERGGIALLRTTILFAQGDWERAEGELEDLLSTPTRLLHAPAYHRLCLVQVWLRVGRGGDPSDAIPTAEEAARAFRDFHQPLNEALALHVLGRLHASAGRREAALDHYARAIEIAQRIDRAEVEAGVRTERALEWQTAGEKQSAVAEAHRALVLFETAFPRGRQWGASPFWLVQSAQACWILAEAGEGEAANAFAARHRQRLEARDLPLTRHATGVLLARVAHLGGRKSEVRRHLVQAWSAVAKVGLRHFSPDLNVEVLRWAAEQARTFGIEPRTPDAALGSLGVSTTSSYRIQSFGGLRVWCSGREIRERDWNGATQRKLLQRLLAAEGHSMTRDQIQADLWPDSAPENAANSLRVALSRLRDVVEPRRRATERDDSLLNVEGDRVSLRSEAMLEWDVSLFTRAADDSLRALDRGDTDEMLASARRAFDCYTGPFLPECYDDWALDLRYRLEARLLDFGPKVIRAQVGEARQRDAAELAARLVVHAPAEETAWMLLARAELESGDASASLRTIARATSALAAELGAEPSEEMRAIEVAARERVGRP